MKDPLPIAIDLILSVPVFGAVVGRERGSTYDDLGRRTPGKRPTTRRPLPPSPLLPASGNISGWEGRMGGLGSTGR